MDNNTDQEKHKVSNHSLDEPPVEKVLEPIPVCKCMRDDESSEKSEMPWRKQQILTTVTRTEDYLRVRRIPELMKFFLTKILAHLSQKPVTYLVNLLDECMMFRAGLGKPPVLYERRHLEAVVKSFDPGNRGWLSAGQVRRAFATLGLPLHEWVEDKTPTDVVLDELESVQTQELFNLLSAGTEFADKTESSVVSRDT